MAGYEKRINILILDLRYTNSIQWSWKKKIGKWGKKPRCITTLITKSQLALKRHSRALSILDIWNLSRQISRKKISKWTIKWWLKEGYWALLLPVQHFPWWRFTPEVLTHPYFQVVSPSPCYSKCGRGGAAQCLGA